MASSAPIGCSAVVVVLALGIAAGAQAGPASTEPAREVVARVNGEVVTRAELDRLLGDPLARQRLDRKLDGPTSSGTLLEAAALRELIRDRLLLEEASRRGLTVSDEELDLALSGLRKRFATLEEFGRWMKARGLDDRSLFEAVRSQLLLGEAFAVLAAGASVAEEEVLRTFESRGGEVVTGEQVRLGIIVVDSPKAAEQALAAMRAGSSFTDAARRHSLGQRAAFGGHTGWVDLQALPPDVLEAVRRLGVGDVAGPLERAPGEHLLVGLADRRPVVARTLDEARGEIERTLLLDAQRELVRQWLDERERTAAIEILLDQPRRGAPGTADHHQAGRTRGSASPDRS